MFGSILQPGFPSAAKLPAIATADKRHGTTLAPHSGVSSFVTHGSRQRNYVLRLENAWPARLSAPQAEREASPRTSVRSNVRPNEPAPMTGLAAPLQSPQGQALSLPSRGHFHRA